MFFDEIARGVTGEGEFGENGDVGAEFIGLKGEVEDFGGVRVKIAYRVVDLS